LLIKVDEGNKGRRRQLPSKALLAQKALIFFEIMEYTAALFTARGLDLTGDGVARRIAGLQTDARVRFGMAFDGAFQSRVRCTIIELLERRKANESMNSIHSSRLSRLDHTSAVYLRPHLFTHPPCKYAAVVRHRLRASGRSSLIAVESCRKQCVHEVNDIDVTMCSHTAKQFTKP